MRPKSVGRLAAVASATLLLVGMASTSPAQAQGPGPIVYSIEFSNPQEKDNDNLPEPYGYVSVNGVGRQTTLWEHPDRDLNTPTLPRYPESGVTHRFVDHSVRGVCAEVGEDDTGINRDDVLAAGCAPYHGPGEYTIPGEDGSVTVTIHHLS
ncbi:hypothetical protein [Streptomyces iconiensis]|uniref:Secreted protein n=1 Tax=Streptomyces iconiensis TaxID=1384038 RepID=A0ABT6ZUA2_9ACTN|nr:hypothetical protein [Streptomyces iconiensis]MDJ1132028.1 hypothetical protein [Streptomyces iconiensis]